MRRLRIIDLERTRSLIADLKLEERVILTGPLFGKEELEALVDADLFVFYVSLMSRGDVREKISGTTQPALEALQKVARGKRFARRPWIKSPEPNPP